MPQAGEVIEVCVLPPPQGGRTNPLSARARVVRCHAVDAEYELGLARKNQVIARTPTARTTAVHDCGNPAVRP
ncbi:hypothetical protein [Jeongeupia sp. USM3]|uniref:hypothetical protein n=1 Tax=Jeongeupia sp. USM3 TaxID=1906741 RepID=UPI00089DE49B|nr:hypothetical protein [Jeongeupia sp. USM3]AOY02121.1 hypothetical protein BJP62_17745 [Jeongeupia sp. USM3]